MAIKEVVSMNEQGRMTMPATVRQALHVEGKAQWEVEVKDNAVIFRPALVIPREDAWAYNPEHLDRVARARQEAHVGETRQLTADDLEQLAAAE